MGSLFYLGKFYDDIPPFDISVRLYQYPNDYTRLSLSIGVLSDFSFNTGNKCANVILDLFSYL